MALTFPLPMPTGGGDSQSFMIGRVDLASPTVNGAGGSVTAGFPRWRMELNLNNTTDEETDEWISFLDSLRGSQRLFLARDLTRPYPKAYPIGFGGLVRGSSAGGASGSAFDGSAVSWSVNTDRDLLTLSGLPNGLKLGKRDSVGFRWTTGGGARRALVRAVEIGTASAAGVVTSLTVEPAIPSLVPATAVAFLNQPDCLMRVVTEETSIGPLDTLNSATGTIVALQELLP